MRSTRGDINFTLILWVLAALLLVTALIFPLKLKAQGKSLFDLVTFGKDSSESTSEAVFAEEDIAEETTLRIERLDPTQCCYYDLVKLEEDKGWSVVQERSFWFDSTLSKNLHLEEIFELPEITGRLFTYCVRTKEQSGWFYDTNTNAKRDASELQLSAQDLVTVVTRSYAGVASPSSVTNDVDGLMLGKKELYPLTPPEGTAFFFFSKTETKGSCTKPANYDGRLYYTLLLEKPESCKEQACVCTCETESSYLMMACVPHTMVCANFEKISYVQSGKSTTWSGRGIVRDSFGILELSDERAQWTCTIPVLVGDGSPYPFFVLKQTDTVLEVSN